MAEQEQDTTKPCQLCQADVSAEAQAQVRFTYDTLRGPREEYFIAQGNGAKPEVICPACYIGHLGAANGAIPSGY